MQKLSYEILKQCHLLRVIPPGIPGSGCAKIGFLLITNYLRNCGITGRVNGVSELWKNLKEKYYDRRTN